MDTITNATENPTDTNSQTQPAEVTQARAQLDMEDYLDWIAAWPANKRPKYAKFATANPAYLVDLYQASKESKKKRPNNVPSVLWTSLESEELEDEQWNDTINITPGTNDAEASSSKLNQLTRMNS
ncbi:hypothetical protein MKX03_010108 [Papaver bracteatum]|nr:hypothetical protein MKX03_010108 [Papaver bracteatum]